MVPACQHWSLLESSIIKMIPIRNNYILVNIASIKLFMSMDFAWKKLRITVKEYCLRLRANLGMKEVVDSMFYRFYILHIQHHLLNHIHLGPNSLSGNWSYIPTLSDHTWVYRTLVLVHLNWGIEQLILK